MGFAEHDLLHLAFDTLAADIITDPHFLADHDQYAGKKILENILKSETDGNGADTQSGDQAPRRQVR